MKQESLFLKPFQTLKQIYYMKLWVEDFFFNRNDYIIDKVLDEMLSIVKHRIKIIETRDGNYYFRSKKLNKANARN